MEGVLSKGVLSGNGLCLEGVMYGGGFVRGGFVRAPVRGQNPLPPYIIPSRQSISGQNPLINDARERVNLFIMLVIIKYLVCIYICYIPNYIYIYIIYIYI